MGRRAGSWHGGCISRRQEQKLARLEATQEIETSFYRASAAADQPAQKDTETTMNATRNTKSGSSIEQQISSVNMSQHERNAVLHDASIAALIVDAIVWVGTRFERFGADAFAKPSPKY